MADVIISKAFCFLQSYEAVHGDSKSLRPQVVPKWCKPLDPWIRINVDAAVTCSSKYRGIGLIGRNSSGLVVFTVAKHLEGTFSAKISEAIVILCAVEETISQGLHHVELESDCQRVVNLLSSSVRGR